MHCFAITTNALIVMTFKLASAATVVEMAVSTPTEHAVMGTTIWQSKYFDVIFHLLEASTQNP